MQISDILKSISGWCFPNLSQLEKPFSKLKVTNIVSIDIALMSLLQYLDMFLPFIEDSEIVLRGISITKDKTVTRNTCAAVSFAMKLQAELWQLH